MGAASLWAYSVILLCFGGITHCQRFPYENASRGFRNFAPSKLNLRNFLGGKLVQRSGDPNFNNVPQGPFGPFEPQFEQQMMPPVPQPPPPGPLPPPPPPPPPPPSPSPQQHQAFSKTVITYERLPSSSHQLPPHPGPSTPMRQHHCQSEMYTETVSSNSCPPCAACSQADQEGQDYQYDVSCPCCCGGGNCPGSCGGDCPCCCSDCQCSCNEGDCPCCCSGGKCPCSSGGRDYAYESEDYPSGDCPCCQGGCPCECSNENDCPCSYAGESENQNSPVREMPPQFQGFAPMNEKNIDYPMEPPHMQHQMGPPGFGPMHPPPPQAPLPPLPPPPPPPSPSPPSPPMPVQPNFSRYPPVQQFPQGSPEEMAPPVEDHGMMMPPAMQRRFISPLPPPPFMYGIGERTPKQPIMRQPAMMQPPPPMMQPPTMIPRSSGWRQATRIPPRHMAPMEQSLPEQQMPSCRRVFQNCQEHPLRKPMPPVLGGKIKPSFFEGLSYGDGC